MNVRAAARVNLVLGLAMAAMALFAATTFPAQAQISDLGAPAPAPAPGAAKQCAATEAEVVGLRGEALFLVLTGVAQAMVAAAADVALAGPLRVLGRCLTVWAHLIGAMNICSLCYVVSRVAVVSMGHCAAGLYLGDLAAGYTLLAMSYAALLGISAAVTCC